MLAPPLNINCSCQLGWCWTCMSKLSITPIQTFCERRLYSLGGKYLILRYHEVPEPPYKWLYWCDRFEICKVSQWHYWWWCLCRLRKRNFNIQFRGLETLRARFHDNMSYHLVNREPWVEHRIPYWESLFSNSFNNLSITLVTDR